MLQAVDDSGWLMLALFVLVVVLFALWRQGIKNRINLATMLALVLIEESEFAAQHQVFLQYIASSKAQSKGALLSDITNGLTGIAAKLGTAHAGSLLDRAWAIKQRNPN